GTVTRAVGTPAVPRSDTDHTGALLGGRAPSSLRCCFRLWHRSKASFSSQQLARLRQVGRVVTLGEPVKNESEPRVRLIVSALISKKSRQRARRTKLERAGALLLR